MVKKALFVLGKGGVGKTTCAAGLALEISKRRKTLLASVDPAPNLGDLFDIKLGLDPVKITEGLYGLEINVERAVEEYTRAITNRLKDVYAHLKALNLDSYLDILRYTPGFEEYAVFEVIKRILSLDEFEIAVIDMPPTGLGLCVLALPFVSTAWLNRLFELRRAILNRRKMLENLGVRHSVRIDNRQVELPSDENRDPIMRELRAIKEEIDEIRSFLQNENSALAIIVVNPETLSLIEGKRAIEALKKFNINVKYVIVNKIRADGDMRRIEEFLGKGLMFYRVPLFEEEPRGIDGVMKVGHFLRGLVDVLGL